MCWATSAQQFLHKDSVTADIVKELRALRPPVILMSKPAQNIELDVLQAPQCTSVECTARINIPLVDLISAAL